VTDQDDDTRQVVLPGEVLANRSDGPLYTEPNTYTNPNLPTLPEKEAGDSTFIPPTITTAPSKSRPRMYALLGLVILAVVSVSALALLSGGPEGDISLALEASATPAPRATVQPEATSVTAASPVPAAIPGDAQVELIYDAESLVLHNRSDEVVDLSGISFVQVIDDAPDLIFQVRRWDGGSASIRELPPGDCFQVWTTEVAFVEVPDYCGLRHKWDQSSFPRWFWISPTPGKAFEIRRSGQVLATCTIEAGDCLVDVRRSS
jgi:hypothetical protein